jgi:Ca2+-binding EF-hand superfamily protein
MQRIMESRYPESSSASGIAQFQDATDGVAQKQRKAYLLKKRADEARVQQLRGIFTAFDEDKDGVLSSRYVFGLRATRTTLR